MLDSRKKKARWV